MEYKYGEFSTEQVAGVVNSMHNDIHKLLLHADKDFKEKIFNTEDDYLAYFSNLLYRFGSLNSLLGEPLEMALLMSSLQAAYNLSLKPDYNFKVFRKHILDAHGYLTTIFKGVN